jgi:ATP phosphoribosyltransferase regulatory subunit
VLDRFDARIGFIAASGVDVTKLFMQTRFVRSLDYYSSFVFEIESPVQGKPAIAGGRYDKLLGRLGSTQNIPAIGFSVWLDRGGLV